MISVSLPISYQPSFYGGVVGEWPRLIHGMDEYIYIYRYTYVYIYIQYELSYTWWQCMACKTGQTWFYSRPRQQAPAICCKGTYLASGWFPSSSPLRFDETMNPNFGRNLEKLRWNMIKPNFVDQMQLKVANLIHLCAQVLIHLRPLAQWPHQRVYKPLNLVWWSWGWKILQLLNLDLVEFPIQNIQNGGFIHFYRIFPL